MKLIIGLGNPGEKYKNNRHNVGYMVIDALVLKTHQIKIFKSQNFMNDSGEFVKKLINQFRVKLSNLWVIHDDLDIRLGDYKIQFGKGPRDHGGILSIEKEFATKGFWRVRIGVDNRREPFDSAQGKEYVLQDFTNEEKKVIDKVIEKVVNDVKRIL